MARFILPIILACVGCCLAELDIKYGWKYIDYVWPSDDVKANCTASGVYDHTKMIPNDVQPMRDGREAITTPRYYYNNPASLSIISDQSGDGGPLLAPYPDWSWHTKTDCSGITNVVTVYLDEYDRLWMVDSGKIINEQVCPAKLIVFDTTTDELVKEVEIPTELSHSPTDASKGYLEISYVQTDPEIENCFVTIADSEGDGVVFWNGTAMWRLDDPIFSPDPAESTFEIAGENITLENNGPKGQMLLLRPEWVEEPALLWKPLSGVKALGASFEDMRNSYKSTPTYYESNFTEPYPESARCMTDGGIFFGAFTGSLFACWNSINTLESANIGALSTNSTILQFVSSVKSIASSSGDSETVHLLSNQLQQFLLGEMDFTTINFRYMANDVATLIEGTACAPGTVTQVSTLADKAFHLYGSSDSS